ncbi:unnamed protein product [Urochloa humidicola]
MVLLSSNATTKRKIDTIRIHTLSLRLFLIMVAKAIVAAPPVALPGCPERCGNITVPYPFGTRLGCFHHGFNLTCDESQDPAKLLAGDGMEVEDISLPEGTVRIRSKMVSVSPDAPNGSWPAGLMTTELVVSTKHNRFVAMGCDFLAGLIVPDYDQYIGVCAVLCQDVEAGRATTADTSCSGVMCCQTPISLSLASYRVQASDLGNLSSGNSASGHGAMFIADKDWFDREEQVLQLEYQREQQRFVDDTAIPTVFEWWLYSDDRSQSLYWNIDSLELFNRGGCMSKNSIIIDGGGGLARCSCSKGFEGNPYIAEGCQDIDECLQPDVYPCHGTCVNMQGRYHCSSKKSIRSLPGLIVIIVIIGGSGLLFSLFCGTKLSKELKQRRARKLRQKYFKRNHGLLLQQLISSNKDVAGAEGMKTFSFDELEQATNKFDHNRILGGGGHGTVYKGILVDQRIVAIKKSNIVVQREIDQFINEVVILSQINHRNVVKLFGCCLEAEVPLLVYEFISNGTLSYHLHGQTENPLPWNDRLRIALETARAIAYLHSAASISVFHRDIKSANILLTDTLTTKVSDFGASRSISIDETEICTAIQGTHGYLDPEYYYTSRLTEKSDVYSFGVILAELLTRIKPVFSSHSSEGTSLASHFVSLIRDNRLTEILDLQIVEEGGTKHAEGVARLAEVCLSIKGEDRPTMRQVEITLEGMQRSKLHISSDFTRVSQNVKIDQSYSTSKKCEGTRQYSMEKEFIQSSEIPR